MHISTVLLMSVTILVMYEMCWFTLWGMLLKTLKKYTSRMTEYRYCKCNTVVICDIWCNVVLNCNEFLEHHPKMLVGLQVELYLYDEIISQWFADSVLSYHFKVRQQTVIFNFHYIKSLLLLKKYMSVLGLSFLELLSSFLHAISPSFPRNNHGPRRCRYITGNCKIWVRYLLFYIRLLKTSINVMTCCSFYLSGTLLVHVSSVC